MWVQSNRRFARTITLAALAALPALYARADIPLLSIARTGDPLPRGPGTNFVFFRTGISLAQCFGFAMKLVGVALTAAHGDLATLLQLQVK